MPRTILIEPRDPLIFRDPRPAEASLPIRSLDWPFPSSIIGAIRTRLGRLTAYDPGVVEQLKNIGHIGPVLAIQKSTGMELAFPAPADAILFDGKGGPDVVPLRPRPPNLDEGSNVQSGISLLFGARERKPLSGPRFWTESATLAWLADTIPEVEPLGPGALARQRRTHLEIDPGTLAAKEGRLFTTDGLELAWMDESGVPHSAAICSRILTDGTPWAPLERLAPLGGERRLAYWTEADVSWPDPTPSIVATQFLRLQLITPAAFKNGWKPGWLNAENEGSAPGLPDVALKLVAAAVPRAVPHSGWDMTKPAHRAQKPTRFLVPAGSVYFFTASKAVDAQSLWLRSICDEPQDRRDGFGLVLCGGWKWQSE